MRKSNLGNLIVIALVALNVIVWLVFPPVNDGSDTFLRKYAGEIIGLTPFLSFIRDMDGTLDRDVNFYYCVRHPEEALFVDELESAAQKNPRLKLHVRCSSKDGSLTIEHILADAGGDVKDHHVYLCGPLPMTQAFESKFLALGVPKDRIHYEEFNFR